MYPGLALMKTHLYAESRFTCKTMIVGVLWKTIDNVLRLVVEAPHPWFNDWTEPACRRKFSSCHASRGRGLLTASHLCFSRSAAHLGEKGTPGTLSSRRHDAAVTCHTLWSTLVSVFHSPTSCQLPLLRSEALSPGRKQQTAEALWHKTLDEFVFLMCHREPFLLAQCLLFLDSCWVWHFILTGAEDCNPMRPLLRVASQTEAQFRC